MNRCRNGGAEGCAARRISRWLGLGGCCVALGGTAISCGSSKPGPAACVTGTLRCECYRNNSCDEGLTCASGLCVVFDPSIGGATGGISAPDTDSTKGGTGAFGGSVSLGAAPGVGGGSVSLGAAPGVGGATVGTTNGSLFGTGGAQTTSSEPAKAGTVRLLSEAELLRFDALACKVKTQDAVPFPSKLQLVVDVSSSMNTTAPGTNRSLWEVTRDALVEAIVGVNTSGLSPETAIGLLFYPNMVNSSISRTPVASSVCVNTQGATAMAALGDNAAGSQRSLLRAALTVPVLGRGTPTVDAYDYALAGIAMAPEAVALPGDLNLLLVTDGQPTLDRGCYNAAGQLNNLPGDPVVDTVAQAFAKAVRTFVVALPGTEADKTWLSRAAAKGGTPKTGCAPEDSTGPLCHMDLTTAPDVSAALREALLNVAASLSPCQFHVPAADAGYVEADQMLPVLRLANGTALLMGRASGSGCSDGYRLVDATHGELCSNTCTQVKNVLLTRRQLVFGCTLANAPGG